MPKPCSNDLRERVVRAVLRGRSCRAAALQFAVAPSSAVKWVARWRERGSVSPGTCHGVVRSPLHAHRKWLLELVAKEDLALADVRDRLVERGLRVAISSIWRFLDREGMTFKKKRAAGRTGSTRSGKTKGKLASLPRSA
jgi:putative transposase